MRAGRLRHQVVVEMPVKTADAYGQPITTWSALGLFWAGVEPLSGKERLLAAAERAEISTRIIMRYRSDVDATCRVRFGSKRYDIQSVIDPDERHIELHLMCVEGLSDGQ